VVALVVASFATLNLQWAQFASWTQWVRMGRFVGELLHPQTTHGFSGKVVPGQRWKPWPCRPWARCWPWLGLVLALPASKPTRRTRHAGVRRARCCSTRCAAHPSWCGPPCF
jgi:phosphonate transport system permease protein